jgi:hypothetical protein
LLAFREAGLIPGVRLDMSEILQPAFEAQVSAELARLVRSARHNGQNAPPPSSDPDHEGEAFGTRDEMDPGGAPAAGRAGSGPPFRKDSARAAGRLGWPAVKLRRDGARPLVFRGLLVASRSDTFSVEDPNGRVPIKRILSVYTTDAGDLAAHVACHPPEDAPARPVHRALLLDDDAAVEALLRSARPEACFSVSSSRVLGIRRPGTGEPAAFNGHGSICHSTFPSLSQGLPQ